MEETNRNSMKLDIEAVRLSDGDRELPRETYKPIPEYPANSDKLGDGAAVKNSNMVREKSDNIEDGAAETMLSGNNEKEQLALKEEVKFISGDHKNGDAKIDIGGLEKSFTGMTKEELMRYANDPFWVRLRWIFFILFWALWVAMLVGAIMIIVGAPKCAAPVPLAWYKRGPLVVLKSNVVDAEHVKELKALGTRGVIYELPSDETYLVDTPQVEDRIKSLVASFKDSGINVILDVTANYVSGNDTLFQKAIEDETYRSAFVFASGEVTPNNWLSKVNGSAWEEVKPKQFVLRQFGQGRYDLQLNDTLAKDKFQLVMQHIAKLGVKGVRLANAKHFIVDRALIDESAESVPSVPSAVHTDYDYWTHTHTTYQPGLGALFAELAVLFKNATENDGFLSVTDNVVRPEVFAVKKGDVGIELPVYGLLPLTLARSGRGAAKQLRNELTQIVEAIGNNAWVQWQYAEKELDSGTVGLSEYNMFLMLLPGVPVAHEAAFQQSLIKEVEPLRESPSYQHGSFDVYTDANETVIAYTRIKSGNPGYLVAYNPSDAGQSSDFSKVQGLPEQLTVHMYSKNYDVEKIVEKVKVQSNEIPIAARSVIILTYVPKTGDDMPAYDTKLDSDMMKKYPWVQDDIEEHEGKVYFVQVPVFSENSRRSSNKATSKKA